VLLKQKRVRQKLDDRQDPGTKLKQKQILKDQGLRDQLDEIPIVKAREKSIKMLRKKALLFL